MMIYYCHDASACRNNSRIAALEAELAEARAGLVRERTEWTYLLRTVVTDARTAALEEAARYIEGLGMPGAVGIRALASDGDVPARGAPDTWEFALRNIARTGKGEPTKPPIDDDGDPIDIGGPPIVPPARRL